MKLGRRATADGPGDFEQVPQIRVGAGFFGEGGTAQPLRNAADPNLGSMNERDAPEPQWEPGRRRAVPPRQRQVFRQPEFDEPEEPGFARVARLISSVLSFGLYAAVAGAVILVAWNLHLGSGERPAAAKLEPAATASKPAPVIAPPASAPAASAPILAQSASAPAQQAPVGVIQAQRPPRQLPPGVIVAGGQQQPVVQPQPDQSALQPSGAQASAPPASQDASTDQASAADDSGAQPTDTPAVMPYPMPPQIAAGRGGATSKPAKTTPQTTLNSTGL